jgi:hypothetical protein
VYILVRLEPRRATRDFRARDYFLFILLGALIFFVGLKITFVVVDKWGHDAYVRWDGLACYTLGLFGFFVCDSVKFLRKWRFWVLTAVLLVVHLAAFAIVLAHAAEWKMIWFMVMVLEYPVLVFFRNRLPYSS